MYVIKWPGQEIGQKDQYISSLPYRRTAPVSIEYTKDINSAKRFKSELEAMSELLNWVWHASKKEGSTYNTCLLVVEVFETQTWKEVE